MRRDETLLCCEQTSAFSPSAVCKQLHFSTSCIGAAVLEVKCLVLAYQIRLKAVLPSLFFVHPSQNPVVIEFLKSNRDQIRVGCPGPSL